MDTSWHSANPILLLLCDPSFFVLKYGVSDSATAGDGREPLQQRMHNSGARGDPTAPGFTMLEKILLVGNCGNSFEPFFI